MAAVEEWGQKDFKAAPLVSGQPLAVYARTQNGAVINSDDASSAVVYVGEVDPSTLPGVSLQEGDTWLDPSLSVSGVDSYLFTGDNPVGVYNGLTAAVAIVPPTNDEEVSGLLVKMPDTSWGVGQDYAEGNFMVFLSDADSDVQATATPILKTISSTTNATPVAVTTSTAHTYATGDIVRIGGTSVAALNNKWWKITVTGASSFTLNGSTAPGSTSATGFAFTDRSAVLHRLADSGWGTTGSFHLAAGLRGRSGAGIAPYGLWIDMSVDGVGLILDNAGTDEWGQAIANDYIQVRDIRNAGEVVFKIDAAGVPISTKAIYASSGTANRTIIGDVYGFAGIAMGIASDTLLYRVAAGIIGAANVFEFTEIADPAAGGANKARFYARDNGSGKTQLCVRFPTGAVQVLATEP